MSLSHAQSTVVKNNIFMNSGQAQIFVSDKSVRAGGHIFRNNDYFKTDTSTIGVWNSTQTVCANASHTLLSWGKVSGDTNYPAGPRAHSVHGDPLPCAWDIPLPGTPRSDYVIIT